MAFERIEGPIGGARADVHASMVSAAVTNANRSRRRPYRVADFMPTWDRRREPQTPEEMFAAVVALNQRLGGVDLRKKG